MPCQHTFTKRVSEHSMAQHGMTQHLFTLAKQVVPAHFFASVNVV